MTQAVCKACKKKINYTSNTTNLRYHTSKHHPDEFEKDEPSTRGGSLVSGGSSQLTLEEAVKVKFPTTSTKSKKITQALLGFICKDLRPLSVVENAGFRELLNECEPRYQIPS